MSGSLDWHTECQSPFIDPLLLETQDLQEWFLDGTSHYHRLIVLYESLGNPIHRLPHINSISVSTFDT